MVLPRIKKEITLKIKNPIMVILNHFGLFPKKFLNIVYILYQLL